MSYPVATVNLSEPKEATVMSITSLPDLTPADLLAASRCQYAFVLRATAVDPGAVRSALAQTAEDTAQHLRERAVAITDPSFYHAADTPLEAGFVTSCTQARWEDGAYRLRDTVAETREAVPALLGLAFAVQRCRAASVPVHHEVELATADGELTRHDATAFFDVLDEHREQAAALLRSYLTDGPLEIDWLHDTHLTRCGHCGPCREQVRAHRDMLLVEGLNMRTRNELAARYRVQTIEELAALGSAGESLPAAVQKYVNRAQVQLGWASAEDVAAQYPDDAALLDRYGYRESAVVTDTVQELLDAAGKAEEETSAEQRLWEYMAGIAPQDFTVDQLAVAMVAEATGYYRRERTQFWTEHFQRLSSDIDEWEQTRDVAVFERVAVEEEWGKDPDRPRAQPTRLLGVRAQLGEGSGLKGGEQGVFLMYRAPFPPFIAADFAHSLAKARIAEREFESVRHGWFKGTVESVEPHGDNVVTLRIRESLPRGAEPFDELPMALSPGTPIPTKAQETALAELAGELAESLPDFPASAGLDLLRRVPPRLVGGQPLPTPDEAAHGSLATLEALHRAVHELDGSYVAVQGPPGTGKTFVGANVISRLLLDGWKIGVVAQSHAVVENVLSGVLDLKKISAERVVKFKGKSRSENFEWSEVSEAELAEMLVDAPGVLIGGTAWDFASEKKFPAQSLDLLVIDEAGQYSLANTLAVARAARNLLLLGDPQQLPQVTQGSHDYPVDESALGWLANGADTLPPEFGYFLAQSWRMHPQLCAAVSELSYAGELNSAEAGSRRRLAGVEPGVYLYEVEHSGNTTASPEEADAVVDLARRFVGMQWCENTAFDTPRPLRPSDIVVVAAYNAQVDLIGERLAAAGLTEEGESVRVGTVDKFQGQQAPVVLVSMAASSAGVSARGADFLLSANRLNVALSRGKWCAVIVASTHLTHFLPGTPEALLQLGRVVRLKRAAAPLPDADGFSSAGPAAAK